MKLESTNKKIKTLCALLVTCMLVGCKSPSNTGVSNATITKTEEVFFNSIIDKSFQFKTFSAKLKFEFEIPQKELSSRAQLKMIYNERMQISIQPLLGIEMFRIEISSDSVKIIDRMNKRYMTESYNNIKNETDVDFNFNNLQSLITNQIFIPGENHVSSKEYRRFRMDKTENSAELKFKDKSGILYSFMADGDEKLISTSITDKSDETAIFWKYNDFQDINGQLFPFQMAANISSQEQKKASIVLTFSAPVLNSPLEMEFKIPTGYKKVTFSQIKKSL